MACSAGLRVPAVAREAGQELLKAAKQPREGYVILKPKTDLSTSLTILWRPGSCSTKMDKHFGQRTNTLCLIYVVNRQYWIQAAFTLHFFQKVAGIRKPHH